MNKKKNLFVHIPSIGLFWEKVNNRFSNRSKPYWGSHNYCIQCHRPGLSSSPDSYDRLAEFKADIINTFVQDHNIKTVIYFWARGLQSKLWPYSAVFKKTIRFVLPESRLKHEFYARQITDP
jgi:hypothetical protein